MTAKEVFMKTLPFCWMKLGLGVLVLVLDALLFALLMGIALLFESEGVAGVMIIVWFALIGIVNFVFNHYLGYLVKAGHVAVIARTYKESRVPGNCVSVGKAMVKERFGTTNVYFAVDRLVGGAVKQLQRTLGRVTDTLLGGLPGADTVKSATNFFLNISLGYIDECCLGYTFYKSEQNVYKSACDGVVIYAQNWKALLKNAAMTALTVIVSMLVVTLVAFVIFGGLFRLFGWSGFVAFVLALLFAWTVKYAFVDSWMMVKMMSGYMQVAPTTVITFDLYGKLGKLSAKFKELFGKSNTTAGNFGGNPAYAGSGPIHGGNGPASSPAYGGNTPGVSQIPNATTAPASSATSFCPNCGTAITPGKQFCRNCGTRVG